MKAINPDIRLCALSATVPNVDDVGKWLRPTNANESDWRKEDGSIDLEEMGSAKVFTVSSSLKHRERAWTDMLDLSGSSGMSSDLASSRERSSPSQRRTGPTHSCSSRCVPSY